jgi:hypothetical protein
MPFEPHPHQARAAHDPHSQQQVDLRDKPSREGWATALGVTVEALESAVQAVGPRVDCIKDYLTTGMAGDQEDG